MGNRDDLIDGAKRCLLDKGYARTTIRDIGGAAGVSTAAIGYHFGSKEGLLATAYRQLSAEWGDEMAAVFAADPAAAEPLERFAATWGRVIESFQRHRRMWAVSFELLPRLDVLPSQVRADLVQAQRDAQTGLARLFAEVVPVPAERQSTMGAFYQTLLSGLLTQWLVDPDSAPTAADLVDSLRMLAAVAQRSAS